MATTLSPAPAQLPEIRVNNPRTGEALYTLQEPSDAEIDRVYATARNAFEGFRRLSVGERIEETRKLKRYLMQHKEEIVQRIVEETGKPRLEAMLTEVFPTLDLIQYYEKHAGRILKDEKHATPLVLMGKKSKVYYEPIGPVLIISPWNYPFNLSMTPIITALVAGNSVVFKPSEYTPLKGLLEDIFTQSGFRKDVVQVVYGGKETGRRLVSRKPAKVFFTGSEAAGKAIMGQCAQDLTPVELELGGKDPMIVFNDVNLNRAVNGAVWGALTNTGQTCTSVERIYVQEPIYNDFVREFKREIEQLHDPLTSKEFNDRNIDMGCMTTDFQIEKVEAQVADALAKGAVLECGGKRKQGHVYPATLLSNVVPGMKIYYEESFGPITTITPFMTDEDAIRLANDSPYGLSASVWSNDIARADRVAREIVTGNVSINNVLATQGNSALPFGGTKNSGIGRYKGAHGLYSFSNIKSIMVDRNSGRYEPIWYPYTPEKYELVTKLIDCSFGGGLLNLLRFLGVGLRLERLEKKRHL